MTLRARTIGGSQVNAAATAGDRVLQPPVGMLAMRFLSFLLSMVLLSGVSRSLQADPPRTALKGPPMINGREVRELLLVAPVQVGEKLPSGLPTTITYEMLPNRFAAVCEDARGIFYQNLGPFQNMVANATLGGLYVTKRPPVWIFPYTGNARYLRMPLSLDAPLGTSDLRKLRFRSHTGKN